MNDGSNTTDNNEETNPYLALRQSKIARNQARLKELGLVANNVAPSKKPKPAPRPPPPTTTSETQDKDSFSPPPPVVARRSRRLSRQQTKTADGEITTAKEDNKKEQENFHQYDDDAILRRPKRPRPSSSGAKKGTPAPPAPNSVRSITLDPERLVLGDDNDDNDDDSSSSIKSSILGVSIEKTGKEFVIYKSFERAAHSEDRARLESLSSSRLSFNKYSGVQEWKNVVFLWVNLGAPNGTTVVNDFLEDGRQITWFGGSRMREETPVVQKLLTLGKSGAADDSSTSMSSSTSSSMLILWCRRYNRTTKSFLPYICLGRLSYHSHVPDSYPVSFVWNLLDYDKLVNSTKASVREQFQQCLQIS
jgi:hypothetical protein